MTQTITLAAPPLIEPGHPGYDDFAPWNRAVTSRPAAIVAARTPADVVAAVQYGRQHHLKVAVRSTGHGATPVGQDTVLVHTGAMNDVAVDPVTRTATIGAGATWQPVVDAAARYGLAALCGAATGIGAVGYLTGGGLGPLARTYGVSADLVRALEVVVGDGRVLRATPTDNADLYWGLRGGKATLGIVTSVELALVPLQSFYGGALWFAEPDTTAVLHAWHRVCQLLPDEGTTSAAIVRLPPLDTLPAPIAGRQSLAIRFAWVGSPQDGEACLEPLRRAATPLLDSVHLRPYTEIGQIHQDPVEPMSIVSSSALLGEITPDTIDRLTDATRPGDNLQNIVELRHLGGAVARTPEHPSAFCHRDARYGLFVSGIAGPDRLSVESHAQSVRSALAPWTRPGQLVNFASSDDPHHIRRSYDADTQYWLEELGDHYDPDHVLDVGQVVRRVVRSA